MTAVFTYAPAPGRSDLDAGTIRRLREVLLADRSARMALGHESHAVAAELTGQRDVDSILEREVAGASASQACEAVEEIDAALARMDGGTYGVCESCSAPIAVERLDVVPHTRRCVLCAAPRRGVIG